MSDGPAPWWVWVLCVVALSGNVARAQGPLPTPAPGDVLPFRLLYGNPGEGPRGEVACFVWNEGGRLHVRVTADDIAHEIEGALHVSPAGVLKDVSLHAPGMRVRQPRPSLLEFDTRTGTRAEELSVVLAGDIEVLRVDLHIDGEPAPTALRIGEKQERPKGLPADLALTGARASWIERFGFN